MTALRILLARLLGLLGGDLRRERELRAEIDAHIAEAMDEYVRRGMTPEEARRARWTSMVWATPPNWRNAV